MQARRKRSGRGGELSVISKLTKRSRAEIIEMSQNSELFPLHYGLVMKSSTLTPNEPLNSLTDLKNSFHLYRLNSRLDLIPVNRSTFVPALENS